MSQQINLYEARLRPQSDIATASNLALCVLALLGVMVPLAVWSSIDASRKVATASLLQKQVAESQEKLTAMTKAVAQRKVSPALSAELENAKATLADRKEVMDVLDSGKLGNTTGYSVFMSGFARQSQPDLWLTGFRVAAGGDEIEIRGRLLDSSRLPAYVQRLNSESVFRGRRFAALEMLSVAPDDPKENAGEGARSVAKGPDSAAGARAPKLPRFVEFVLRSENIGGAEVARNGGVKP